MATIEFKRGRPPTFSKDLGDALIKSIGECLPLHVAAGENGITYESLRLWLNAGKNDLNNGNLTEKAQFFVDVKKEVAKVTKELLKVIRGGTNGWQGSGWILERRWWKDWSNKAADLDFNERLSALEEKQKGDLQDAKEENVDPGCD